MRILKTALLVFVAAAVPLAATDQAPSLDQVVDRISSRETALVGRPRQSSPLVDTYIQNLRPDGQLGSVPAGDNYFLGRADLSTGVELKSLTEKAGASHKMLGGLKGWFTFSLQFLPRGFLQMIYIDTNGFARDHYKFDYVRREFLGEVRCLVFDVTPLPKSGKGRFLGRMWVEDQDFNVVRFNGSYGGGGHSSFYFHFDSWRSNVQPGVWLPAFVYSEESGDLRYAIAKKLSFKAQTRLWGYNIGRSGQVQELCKFLVETPVIVESTTSNDRTPIQAQRSWDRQAEDNVIDRLQRIGLLAPPGEVDKVLDTVVNNLEVTNNIDLDPEVRCRVLMTTTLESFTIGHTVVLSRGLVDVLPDEASLASVLAHELSHAVLGHRLDSQYAFFDRLLVDDKETFRHFGFARTPEEEKAANAKGIEILNNSPYKAQLGNAALFLQMLDKRAKEIPNLISPHLGNRVPELTDVKAVQAPDAKNPQKIAALPLGGRVKLDPWNDRLELIKAKPIGAVAEREKMPFEVTPFMPYLIRYGSEAAKPTSAVAADPKGEVAKKPQ